VLEGRPLAGDLSGRGEGAKLGAFKLVAQALDVEGGDELGW
jgi:hypothetical protein